MKTLTQELVEALRKSDAALSEAREMLGVFEDHGGHDGLGGKGYAATIDHMDYARKDNRAVLARAEREAERDHELARALSVIAAEETPRANATVKRMARVARMALVEFNS